MPKVPLAVLCMIAAIVSAAAQAEPVRAGDLVIYAPWARASAGPARAGAAYLSIHSHDSADRLLGASSPVADRIAPHAHEMADGVMRMRALDAIAIDAHARVTLEPGGLHLMLIGLKAPLKEGARFPMTLRFEKAGSVTLTVDVRSVGSMGPEAGHHGAKNGGKHGHGMKEHKQHQQGGHRH